MRRFLLVTILLLAACGAFLPVGCAKFKPILADIKGSFKGGGEQPLSTLEQTRQRYSCGREDTRFYVEKSDISPSQVEPGDKIQHVVQYALCAPSEAVSVQGTITRKIKFRGKERKTISDAEVETFKAGTWSVTAFIEVPKNAPEGSYTLETVIRCQDTVITRSVSFTVRED
ncbi:MAG: hypothetical protein GYA56_12950 [Geobacteraceae bacterium]|nr:hypothetical protein [Geobacteraceae bacterium]